MFGMFLTFWRLYKRIGPSTEFGSKPRRKGEPCRTGATARDGFESISAAASVRKCTAATGE